MTERERVEGARRARAAIAYAGVKVDDVVTALHISEATAGRILAGTRKETTWEELWEIADLCVVPRDWFSADLSRLSELVPAGQPTFGTPSDLRARMVRESEAHVERVHRRIAAGAGNKRGPRHKARES